MKTKIIYSLAITILSIISCQKINIQEEIIVNSTEKSKEILKRKDIEYGVSLKTASYLADLLSQKDIQKVEAKVYDKDTLFYAVDYEDGWILISGDKRVTPILAESSTGTFTKEIDNIGSAIWFNEIANEIYLLKKNKIAVDETKINKKDFDFWNNIERVSNVKSLNKAAHSPFEGPNGQKMYLCRKLVKTQLKNEEVKTDGHLLKTKWGQGDPWNVNLPNVLDNNNWIKPPTGCTAVMISQILYFTHFKFNIPSGLHHSISSTGYILNDDNYNVSFHRGDYVENSPLWNEMPLTRYGANTKYVADLMADVGNRVGMKYAAGGSGANINQNVMNSYGLRYDESDYSSYEVLNQIRGGMPVMITAYSNKYKTGWWFWKKTHHSGGHAWVIDGVVDRIRNIEYVYTWDVEYAYENESFNESPNPEGTYNGIRPNRGKTYSDLLREYGTVLSFEEAIKDNKYPGDTETEISPFKTTNILMNWGWNGFYDGEYSPYVSSWTAGEHNYQYLKRIYYNIRKK